MISGSTSALDMERWKEHHPNWTTVKIQIINLKGFLEPVIQFPLSNIKHLESQSQNVKLMKEIRGKKTYYQRQGNQQDQTQR